MNPSMAYVLAGNSLALLNQFLQEPQEDLNGTEEESLRSVVAICRRIREWEKLEVSGEINGSLNTGARSMSYCLIENLKDQLLQLEDAFCPEEASEAEKQCFNKVIDAANELIEEYPEF